MANLFAANKGIELAERAVVALESIAKSLEAGTTYQYLLSPERNEMNANAGLREGTP